MVDRRNQRGSVAHGMDRETFLRRALALAVATTGVGALASGCGGETTPAPTSGSATQPTTGATESAGGPPAAPAGTLRVANNEPLTLDPAKASGLDDLPIVRNVYDGLLEYNSDYTELVPGLATSWESSDDAKEWVFHLRSGVTFHDGTPFDSTAVRKTLEWYRDAQGFGAFVTPPEFEVDDSDPAVARVALAAPFPDYARSQVFVRMISPELIAAGPDALGTTMVGTGPFRFVEWRTGSAVILEANTDYWGSGPHLEKLQFLTIPEVSAQLTALRAGDVDLVPRVPPPQIQEFEADSTFALSTVDSWTQANLFLWLTTEPLDNLQVRQAMAAAIDREAIVDGIMDGQAIVANSVVPPGVYGYAEPKTRYTADPAKASELLAAAGYGDGVDLRIIAGSNEPILVDSISRALADQLEQAGFSIKLEILDPGVASKELFATDPTWNVYVGQQGWLTGGPFFLTLNLFKSFSHYDDPEINRLTDDVNSVADGPARLAALAGLQEITARDVLEIPLWSLRLTGAFPAELRGYATPVDGYMPYFGQTYFSDQS